MDTRTAPAEETTAPFGQRWASRLDTGPEGRGTAAAATVLRQLGDVDLAVYRAVAATPTPTLDAPVRRLSDAADRSRLWLAVAAAMATLGGRPGRRAAGAGLLAVAVDSAVVNGILKAVARRRRPDRESARVPTDRRVLMPASRSWPSGHAASGFAFATAVGQVLPAAALPLRVLASAVGYSRVHTGVHFPGDVVTGAVVGATVGEAVACGLWRVHAVPRLSLGPRRGTS
ncbi:undecaprenyl-diphosphatase [Geodermatophilus tzadiensis]|uniref:Undecaprenyl-diphosphatase n=1 Tax=Geodermatophilus tzadiensis TaxID=1137988 RepID=A0A2T0U0B8_9ACTN|nr:phosphatase PAP2 family protein [Geodermatophilus tzadiensis]PRY51367.1 undecaprenyl-diphosphatase [Geodermatophilus tzadiensis]